MTDSTTQANAGQPTATLNSGGTMPLLGFGTFQIRGEEAYTATLEALSVGYRHIDTAKAYGNEQQVGRAIRDSGLDRDEVFVTTKLPPEDAGKEQQVIDASLAALGLDHLDLWLIHWPPSDGTGISTWKEFLAAQLAGKTRAVGVSNYRPAQIDALTDATGTAPSVNQIKWAPALYDAARAKHSADAGVVLEGYSPFRASDLSDPTLTEIAHARDVTVPQVILRWHIDHGFVAIPKSVRPERIRSNFDIFGFSLEAGELARLDGLSTVG